MSATAGASRALALLQGLGAASALDAAAAAGLAEAGAVYNELAAFAQAGGSASASGASASAGGVVQQALAAAVRAQLDLYLRDLASVEREVARAAAAGAAAAAAAEAGGAGAAAAAAAAASAAPPWTVRRLAAWSSGNVRRLRTLQQIVRACEGRRGAHVASCVWSSTQHGDPQAQALAAAVFAAVARPVALACRNWLRGAAAEGVPLLRAAAGGAADDFFVMRGGSGGAGGARSGGLWNEYSLNVAAVPSFLPPALVRDVFMCGRTLRFVHDACRDEAWVEAVARKMAQAQTATAASAARPDAPGEASAAPPAAVAAAAAAAAAAPFSSATLQEALAREAQTLAPVANERLLWLLRERFSLLAHLAAVHRYVLLTQGDFASSLIAAISGELSRPAALVASASRHVIDGIFESAVRATNAQLDDRQVLDRVVAHVAAPAATPAGARASGWDLFSLAYAVEEPVASVVDAVAQRQCAEAFSFLWLLRRCEHVLTTAWSAQVAAHHALRRSGDARVLLEALHRSHLLRADMTAFVQSLLSHAMYEVLAPAWAALSAAVEAAADMDALVAAYRAYLAEIARGLFLRGSGGGGGGGGESGSGGGGGGGGEVRNALSRILRLAIEYAAVDAQQSGAVLRVVERAAAQAAAAAGGAAAVVERRGRRPLPPPALPAAEEDAAAAAAAADVRELAEAVVLHAAGIDDVAARFRGAVDELFALGAARGADLGDSERLAALAVRYDVRRGAAAV